MIDIHRLQSEIDRLAEFTDAPAPAVTRVLMSPTDMRARAYLRELYKEAGLEVKHDAAGNVFARWQGSDGHLPPIATGSHTDALPHAGRYDGVVGVLGGLEAIRALKRRGFAPRRSIELINFTAEEPTRYGLGCLGSRILSGALSAIEADALTDGEGKSFAELRHENGYEAPLATAQAASDRFAGYLELHIEQGPSLERSGTQIGVVEAIAAPAALEVEMTGPGGHAGAVLMHERHDPLLAAAEAALALEKAALETGGVDTVATVGTLDIHPRAVNSIAREARFSIDLRDIDGARRDRVLQHAVNAVNSIAAARGVACEIRRINADPPAVCDEELIAAVERAASGLGYSQQRMISRAYHDATFMSLLCPIAMIFIPCRDGVSHRPDEFASPDAISQGVAVLADVLAQQTQ